jgi:hypothetical protein
MDIKASFLKLWDKYFPGAELPVTFYYTDEEGHGEAQKPAKRYRCFIGDLGKAWAGKDIYFDKDSLACSGAKRYLGYSNKIMPDFEYFLSCGIPEKIKGERYKKTPEMVKEIMKNKQIFQAPGKYIVFKRFDKINEHDQLSVVIFRATPNILSGLYTLSNFDETEPNGVIAPFGAGCDTIVGYPYNEINSKHPRSVLGMFDVSARPYVQNNILTFSVPWPKFKRMVNNMEESFLVTTSWDKIKNRIKKEDR